MSNADYLFCDYDGLSIPDRMNACRQAREDAIDWPHGLSDSPWTALDKDDPRRVAFENAYAKHHKK